MEVQNNSRARKEIADSIDIDDYEKQRAAHGNDRAADHTYESVVTDPTCTENGYTTHTCHCGDSYVDSEVDALGHSPSDWIVDAEAQIGVEGSKHKECTVCGETLETEVIEALTEAPTTEASSGCNGTISASVALLALLSCFAVAWRPCKDN